MSILAAWPSVPGAVAALPALPLGKGALILILGGLVALAVSLMWSLLSPRARAAPHAAHAGAAQAATPAPPVAGVHAARVATATGRSRVVARRRPAGGTPTMQRPAWLESVSDATFRMGFGNLHVVGVEGASCLVTLTACRSCHGKRVGDAGCDLEARSLKRAVRQFAPRAAVNEVRCRHRGEGSCVFELRPEGPA